MNAQLFDEAFNKYREKFGEPFPMMEYMSADDNELYEMMTVCISEGKPATELYPISDDYKY